jgi:hypothetical protein
MEILLAEMVPSKVSRDSELLNEWKILFAISAPNIDSKQKINGLNHIFL